MPGSSRINGGNQTNYQPIPEDESKNVEVNGRKVQKDPAENKQLPDRATSLEKKSLKDRKVRHQEAALLRDDKLSMIRKLVNRSAWTGVEQSFISQVENLEQLQQVLDSLRVPNAQGKEFQTIAVKRFCDLTLQAIAKHLLATPTKESTRSQLETLGILMDKPTSSSSPIGAIIRSRTDEFIKKNAPLCLEQRQKMIQTIEKELYSLAALKMEKLENQWLKEIPDNEEVRERVKESRNERQITMNYFRDLATPA